MAQSVIKNVSKNLANSFTFNRPVEYIFYKEIHLIGKAVLFNIELNIDLSGKQPNTWIDIGNVSLPSGIAFLGGQLIDSLVTDGNYGRTGNATFRIDGTKLQLYLTNLDGTYIFINGIMAII